jgi:hypothetical protein
MPNIPFQQLDQNASTGEAISVIRANISRLIAQVIDATTKTAPDIAEVTALMAAAAQLHDIHALINPHNP